MKLIKKVGELRRDFTSFMKKDWLKIFGIHLGYMFILIIVFMFLLSILGAYLAPFQEHVQFLSEFKQTYTQTGEINSSQGQSLIDFQAFIKQAIKVIIILTLIFSAIYASLRSLKTKMFEKLYFKKKLPKNYYWIMIIPNFLFVPLLMAFALLLLIKINSSIIFIILLLLIFLILESLIFTIENNYLKRKISFGTLFSRHLIVNAVFLILFIIGIIIVSLFSNLFSFIGVWFVGLLYLILLFMMYVKRETLLMIVIEYLIGEKK